ncbi:MAG: hypothetical protein NTZ33_14005 [Bacteroidetes bacterium]|nr:hypothetical protein [Bacteroidota bacterium]
MTNITLTPDVLTDFLQKDMPAQVTVGLHGFLFNKAAEKLLALKPEATFSIIFEDGKIFYTDVPKGGFKVGKPSGRHNLLMAAAHKVKSFFLLQLKKEIKILRFEIGDMKEGKRELTLVK